jgi:hypothetical protein
MPQMVDTYVDTAAQSVGVEIPLEYRSSVIAHVATMLAFGELILSVPLPPEVESAQVFRP